MTHAMVISGVHIDPATNKPVRYKVENSWGDAVGDHGHFVMTDRWFEEFVFQIVVPKPLAPKHLVEVFEANEPVVFPPWDPLVSFFFFPLVSMMSGGNVNLPWYFFKNYHRARLRKY